MKFLKMFTIGGVLVVCSLFSTFNAFGQQSKEVAFWGWFQENDNTIFHFESNQEKIFDKLSSELKKINSDLTFEFGPIENGRREFIISAAGIKSAFPSVEALFSSAPKLEKWEFIKFRPRHSVLNDLKYGGKSISAKDVFYQLVMDGNKIGIILFLNGYTEADKTTYEQIGYLMLDEALGEYDMETKVGVIEFQPKTSKYFLGARPLSELASDFDTQFTNLPK